MASHTSDDSRSSHDSHISHTSACSSHVSADNYHIGASNSMSSEEDRIPRKNTRFEKIKARKPIKQACSKAACRKKEQAYLVDTSDEDNEFAGSN